MGRASEPPWYKNKRREMSDGMDKVAFEAVYRRHYAGLYRYAYDFLGDEEWSRDVVADVFMRLWGERGRLSEETLQSFLYVSVRNGCLNMLRRRKTGERYERWVRASMEHEDAESLLTLDERIKTVEAEMDKMSERTRHVLEQCYLEGHTYREVAEEMGITTDGVKKHIVKAFAALRERFGVKKA